MVAAYPLYAFFARPYRILLPPTPPLPFFSGHKLRFSRKDQKPTSASRYIQGGRDQGRPGIRYVTMSMPAALTETGDTYCTGDTYSRRLPAYRLLTLPPRWTPCMWTMENGPAEWAEGRVLGRLMRIVNKGAARRIAVPYRITIRKNRGDGPRPIHREHTVLATRLESVPYTLNGRLQSVGSRVAQSPETDRQPPNP